MNGGLIVGSVFGSSPAEAADHLMQRVQIKKMEQARGAWLKTVRKQHHVEIR